MIYIDESETLGGLLACANKYVAVDDDNREDAESRRRESGKKKVEDQAGPAHEVAATFGKGGQSNEKWQDKNVTTPTWYCKIRTKISLLHCTCIMAYIFKIAKFNKATIGKHLKGKPKPSPNFQAKCKSQIGKTIILEFPNCSGSSKNTFFKIIFKGKFLPNKEIKLRIQNWFK